METLQLYSGTTNVTSAVFQVGDGTGNTFNDHAGTVNIDANSALELNPGTSGTITTLINSEGSIRNIPHKILLSAILVLTPAQRVLPQMAPLPSMLHRAHWLLVAI